MEEILKKDVFLFKQSVISLIISAFSILLTFIGNYEGNAFNVIIAVAAGVLFWGGMIYGYILLFIINSHRRAAQKNRSSYRRPGFLCFFSNKPAFVIDILLIFLIILNLVFIFVPVISQTVWIILIALLLASVHMHGLFNGINFIYINFLNNQKESRK